MTDVRLGRQSVRVLFSNPSDVREARQSARVLFSNPSDVREARQSARVLVEGSPDTRLYRQKTNVAYSSPSDVRIFRQKSDILYSHDSELRLYRQSASALVKYVPIDTTGYWGGLLFDKEVAFLGSTYSSSTILLGIATHTGLNETRLTNGSSFSTAGVFYNQKFSKTVTKGISFTYTLSSGGADGWAVAFINSDLYSSAPVLGSEGGQMAIVNGGGMYVEFKTYSADRLYITPNGSSAHAFDTGYAVADWGGTHTVKVTIDGSDNVKVYRNDTQIYAGVHAVPNNFWIGVVGATGGSTETLSLSNGHVLF